MAPHRDDQVDDELHVREVGRAQDDVRAFHDEPAVEPGAHDAVRMGTIPPEVEGVQAEHRLDAVPSIIGKELLPAYLSQGDRHDSTLRP
jgi:hypothetical protein